MSESTETTPAVKLRSEVVLLVIRALIGLAAVELVLIGLLLGFSRDIPGELWLAFGTSSGALTTLLVNSKHSQDGPVPVVGVEGGAVITKDEAAEETSEELEEPVKPKKAVMR